MHKRNLSTRERPDPATLSQLAILSEVGSKSGGVKRARKPAHKDESWSPEAKKARQVAVKHPAINKDIAGEESSGRAMRK